MAVIYMRHEKHGTKVACSEEEARYDESLGWTRFTVRDPVREEKQEETPPAETRLDEDGQVDDREQLSRLYQSKFGKAPDGRLSTDSIRRRLGL